MKKYPDPRELYQKKEANRRTAANLPIGEKISTLTKLRDMEKTLAPNRAANKAKRAAKQIKIRVKTA